MLQQWGSSGSRALSFWSSKQEIFYTRSKNVQFSRTVIVNRAVTGNKITGVFSKTWEESNKEVKILHWLVCTNCVSEDQVSAWANHKISGMIRREFGPTRKALLLIRGAFREHLGGKWSDWVRFWDCSQSAGIFFRMSRYLPLSLCCNVVDLCRLWLTVPAAAVV